MNREILNRAVVAIWACWLVCLPDAREGQAGEAAPVTRIVNGSFELRKSGEPPNHIETLKPGSDDILGWGIVDTVPESSENVPNAEQVNDEPSNRYTVDWIGPTRWKASHGDHCLDLDGGISQTVRTAAGESYEVRFELAGNPELGPMVQTLRLLVNDRQHDFKFNSTGKSTGQLGWVTKRVVFTADKTSTSLTFLNARPNAHSAGVALDNVVIRRLGPHSEPGDRVPEGKQSPGKGGGEITPGVGSGITRRTDAAEQRWSKAVRGLVMRLQTSQDTVSLGDDVKIAILIKNVSNETIQTWAHREATFDSYPATSFVVGTPEGKQVVLGRYEFNSNELRFPPKISLEPGQMTRHTVTLSKWSVGFFGPSSFKTTGRYTIRCIFYLDPFGDPYGFPNEAESVKEKRARLESPPAAVRLVAKDTETVTSVERVELLKRFGGLGIFLDDSMMAPAVPRRRPDKGGLALEVEYRERDHLPAEPILVRCSLVNYGTEPITLAYGGRYEQASCIFFDIIGEDGKPIPWVSSEEEDSPGPQPLTIPSGKRFVEWYNLVDHYGLTKPGRYKVNVRFESDGKSFNPSTLQTRSDLWKGKIERKLGALTIVEPTRPVDKAALEALRVNAANAIDSPFHFVYMFSATDISGKFDDFLNQHGDSRYAAYARCGNALAALHRVQRGTPSYAKAAIENLKAIDASNYPALFAERRLFHLIQAHVAADSKTEQITSLYQRLLADYPHSPFLSLLKSGGQSENAKRE